MKKNIVQNTIALLLLTLFVGCGAKDITKRQAVDHLSKSGLDGNASDELLYQIIGADDGFKWRGTDFSIEAYKFSSPDKISLQCNYINGNWGVRIYRDKTSIKIEDKIIKSFDELFGTTGKVIITDKKARTYQLANSCKNNLIQLQGAFEKYSLDHQDRMPSGVHVEEGGCAGSEEYRKACLQPDPDGFNDAGNSILVNSYDVFKSLGKYLNYNTELLICPSDESAIVASDWELINEKSVSYKFGTRSDESQIDVILNLCNHHAKDNLWVVSLCDFIVDKPTVRLMNKDVLQNYWVNQFKDNKLEKLNIP